MRRMIEAWETQPAVIVSLGALLAIVACARDSNPRRQRLAYPESPREEQVDDYHGSQVADPYRWLEELDAQRTAEWVNDQNALSGPLLADLPLRAHFETRLTELSDYDRIGLPRRFGNRLFWERNDGLQDQYELVVVDGGGRPRVLLDPNGFSSDATIALAGWQPSPDGSLIAFARSDGGSDWRDWHVRVLHPTCEQGDSCGKNGERQRVDGARQTQAHACRENTRPRSGRQSHRESRE